MRVSTAKADKSWPLRTTELCDPFLCSSEAKTLMYGYTTQHANAVFRRAHHIPKSLGHSYELVHPSCYIARYKLLSHLSLTHIPTFSPQCLPRACQDSADVNLCSNQQQD